MLVLPYPISANRYWRLGLTYGEPRHAIVHLSKEAKSYRRECQFVARAAHVKPIQGRLAVTLLLYPHKPLDAAKRMKRDPDNWDDDVECMDTNNCAKVVLDALQGVLYDDDKWLWRVTCERQEPDDQGKRLVVIIEPMSRPESPRIALPLGVIEQPRSRAGLSTFEDVPF